MGFLRSRKNQKIISRLVLALIIVGLGFISEASPELAQKVTNLSSGTYTVASVSDGDTIVVEVDGRRETVRFIGVDTPETHDPRKTVQCFGRAASAYTAQLIGTQAVRLAADPLSSNRDRYGRLLRYVYLPDGRLVQAEILKEGYGFAYTSFPFTKSEEFLNLQRQAREHEKGLWKECTPELNQYGGYTSPPAQ